MKFSISFAGRDKTAAPSMPEASVSEADSAVMPIEIPAATVPAEVKVMPSTGQEQVGLLQELQTILFPSRLKVAIPADGAPQYDRRS